MAPASEWDEDGMVKVARFAKMMDLSANYCRELFDAGVLPGAIVGKATRLVDRRFAADLFAEVRYSGAVVRIEDYSVQWRAAQISGRAA